MKFLSAHSPKWTSAARTSIDVIVVTDDDQSLPYTARAGDGWIDGEEIFASAVAGKFGKIAPFIATVPSPELLQAIARDERVRRVTIAYGDPEKRMSLYGYLAQLNAIDRPLTDIEAADRATLIAAAEWEQAMIDAIPALVAKLDVAYLRFDDDWPKMKPDVAASLTKLAEES